MHPTSVTGVSWRSLFMKRGVQVQARVTRGRRGTVGGAGGPLRGSRPPLPDLRRPRRRRAARCRPDDRAGERVAFLGPSGSGKSTLLTLLGGIQSPSAGRIFLGDEEISRMGERYLARIRSRQVSTMLQGATRNLLPYATARQNIAFARLSLSGRERDNALQDIELLDRVGLDQQSDQVVSTMSGGQRQRLALACAVSTAPRLLLADEPTSQLSHARPRPRPPPDPLARRRLRHHDRRGHPPARGRRDLLAHRHHEGRPRRRRGVVAALISATLTVRGARGATLRETAR